jgi:hypothetical protein
MFVLTSKGPRCSGRNEERGSLYRAVSGSVRPVTVTRRGRSSSQLVSGLAENRSSLMQVVTRSLRRVVLLDH